MASTRLGGTTVLITSLAVALVECSIGVLAAQACLDRLVVLGVGRLMQIALMLALVQAFHGSLLPIGLRTDCIKRGLAQGLVWSLSIGLIVILTGVLLWQAGNQPWRWIQMSLPHNRFAQILFLVVGGVIGPVAEELFFRGIWYGYLRRWGRFAALALSSLLFLAAHGSAGGWIQVCGGMLFVLAYECTHLLWAPIVIHITGNLTIFGISLIISMITATL